MIIKSSRVRASQVRNHLAAHLLEGDENDAVVVLMGGRDQMEQSIADAKAKGITYAIRHFIISPSRPTSNAEGVHVLRLLAKEFEFSISHVTFVRHEKARLGLDPTVPHFHVAVPEFDPTVSSRVLRTKFDFRSHELIARTAEVELGHPITPGPHQAAVIRDCEAKDRMDVADAIRHLCAPREREDYPTSYTAATAAQVKRAGLDPATTAELIRAAFEVASSPAEFLSMLLREGMTIAPGEKRATTPCIYYDGKHVDALHRVLGVPVKTVRAFLNSQPVPGAAPAPEAPADGVPIVAPGVIMLTAEQMTAEFEAQLAATVPTPPDKTAVDQLTVTIEKAINARKAMERQKEAVAGEIDRLNAGINAMGWLGRVVFKRRACADLRAMVAAQESKAVQNAELIEKMKKALPGYHRQKYHAQRAVDEQQAKNQEAYDQARRRLLMAAAAIREKGLRFPDLDQLRAYIDLEGNPPDAPYIEYRDQPAPRM